LLSVLKTTQNTGQEVESFNGRLCGKTGVAFEMREMKQECQLPKIVKLHDVSKSYLLCL
jgi:hypothetical protein